MRYSPLLAILLLLFVSSCGCLQPSSPAAQPATPLTTVVPGAPTDPGPKQISMSVWTTDSSVVVRYDGGRDAAALSMFRVQIDNRDGKIIKTPIYSPEIGKEYPFRYVGIANPNTINIIGVFNDGTEQTVLIKYF